MSNFDTTLIRRKVNYTCAIPGCSNKYIRHDIDNKCFFTLPKNKFKRTRWLEKIEEGTGVKLDSCKKFHICSDHFEEHQYGPKDKVVRLTRGAYPLIFPKAVNEDFPRKIQDIEFNSPIIDIIPTNHTNYAVNSDENSMKNLLSLNNINSSNVKVTPAVLTEMEKKISTILVQPGNKVLKLNQGQKVHLIKPVGNANCFDQKIQFVAKEKQKIEAKPTMGNQQVKKMVNASCQCPPNGPFGLGISIDLVRKQRKKISKLKHALKVAHERIKKFKRSPENFVDLYLGKSLDAEGLTLLRSQIKYRSTVRPNWTDEEKKLCRELYRRGPNCYKLLHQILKLPSKSTLASFINSSRTPSNVKTDSAEEIKIDNSTV